MKRHILTILLMGVITSSLSANSLSLTDIGNGDWNVNYTSDSDIGGFQFNVDGTTINSATGGVAGANGFMTSASGSMVLGFSMTGAVIPAGDDVLITLNLASAPTGLSGMVMSDGAGGPLDFEYIGIVVPPYYAVDLEATGNSQLTILSDTITNLEVGDEIGVFDGDGITNYNDCSNQIGELLVGAGVWDGTQLNIVSIGSND